MADVVINLKIMLESPDIDTEAISEEAKLEIEDSDARVLRTEVEPVAYGLNAVKITFVMDENRGSSDAIEDKIKAIKGVSSVEVIGVSRALG